MDCPIAQEQITAYLDGELTPEEFEIIRKHLQDCHRCRILAEQAERVKQLLRNKLEFIPAPAGLREKIVRGLNEFDEKRDAEGLGGIRRHRAFTFHYTIKGLFAAAAVVSIIIAGAFLDRRPSADDGARFSVTSPEVEQVRTVSWSDCNLNKDREGNIILTGRIVCIGCEFTHKYGISVDCARHGHHPVLLTDVGLYVDFTPNEKSDHLLHEKGLMEVKVKVVGKLCTKSNFMNIVNYEKLPV